MECCVIFFLEENHHEYYSKDSKSTITELIIFGGTDSIQTKIVAYNHNNKY